MAHSVAPYTRSRDVLCRVIATILLGDQVFRRALQMLGLSQANAVSSREFGRVNFPDGERAVEAAAILANERLVAEFSKFFWVHGNSLGLTSKSPLTCARMAGAVVQRIGGAWAKSNAVGGRDSRASEF
ncbi:hypothetical protein [Candidatus Aalborgicola defluviihabitans]|uniref:hypothetical protein n=1 Tax=Candidatus Aalborgicola defluviihabitans TaxID=3386187 RepID=UPI0039B82431